VRLWDLEKGECLRTLPYEAAAEGRYVTTLALAPLSQCAVFAINDASLEVWDMEHTRHLRTLKGHKVWVPGLAVTPDNRWIVSAGDEGTLRTWDLATLEPTRVIQAHSSPIKGMTLMPDGQHVVTVSSDRTLKVWNLVTGGLVARLDFDSSPQACAITPDGRTLVVGDNHGRVCFLRFD
jgi:WD40 repeat protein